MSVTTKFYSKSKDNSSNIKQSSGGTNILSVNHSISTDKLSTPRKLWGNEFDGTADVDGNITCPDLLAENIDISGDLDVTGSTSLKGTTIDGNASISSNLNVNGKTDSYKMNTYEITSSYDKTTSLSVSGSSNLHNTKVEGNLEVTNTTLLNKSLTVNDKSNLKATDINGDCKITGNTDSRNIKPNSDNTYSLGTSDKQWKELFCVDGWFKNIDVTGSAHFKEVVIDKIKATGGNLVISPATFHVDKISYNIYVEGDLEFSDMYSDDKYINADDVTIINTCILYQYKYDSDTGKEIKNEFEIDDFVYCQTFNIGEGTHSNVSNKYFRSYVINKGVSVINGEDYNFIEIIRSYDTSSESNIWDYGTVNPEVGDELVLLGSYNTDRQNAIIISTVQGLDNTVLPPSIVQYSGINNIGTALNRYKQTQISPSGNIFKGDFTLSSGTTLQNYINTTSIARKPYINSTNNNWMIWNDSLKRYEDSGVCAKGKNGTSVNIKGTLPSLSYMPASATNGDAYIVYGDLWVWANEWTNCGKIQGDKGADAVVYTLIPEVEVFNLSTSGVVSIDVRYSVLKISGNNSVYVNIADENLSVVLETNTENTHTLEVDSDSVYFTDEEYQSSWNEDLKSFTVNIQRSNGSVISSRVVKLSMEAGVTFDINQQLGTVTTRVNSLSGNYSTLTQKANSIESSLGNLQTNTNSKISQLESQISSKISSSDAESLIEQKKDSISASIKTDYASSGLTIDENGIGIEGAITDVNTKITKDSVKQHLINNVVAYTNSNISNPTIGYGKITPITIDMKEFRSIVIPFELENDTKEPELRTVLLPRYEDSYILLEGAKVNGDIPLMFSKIPEYKKSGTHISITYESDTRTTQESILGWSSLSNNAIYNNFNSYGISTGVYNWATNLRKTAILVCSDPLLMNNPNAYIYDDLSDFITTSNISYIKSHSLHSDGYYYMGKRPTNTQYKHGCFRHNGQYGRFVLLLPGQTLKLVSRVIDNVLYWEIENTEIFKPIYHKSLCINSVIDNDDLDDADLFLGANHNTKFISQSENNPSWSVDNWQDCLFGPEILSQEKLVYKKLSTVCNPHEYDYKSIIKNDTNLPVLSINNVEDTSNWTGFTGNWNFIYKQNL